MKPADGPVGRATIGDLRLRLIENCAQGHGALYRGRPSGSFGDVGRFSFYPTKNPGVLDDSGRVVTNQPDLAATLREIREYGWHPVCQHPLWHQFASRCIQALVLGVKLRTLAADNAQGQSRRGSL
jgi:dTDP-4-amino-4,6-dideoxygalactose transaminase